MDKQVVKIPLVTPDGRKSPVFGLYSGAVHIATVGSRYKVVQREGVISALKPIALENEWELMLDRIIKGRHFFQYYIGTWEVNGDSVHRYLTVINPYGKGALSIGVFNHVMSCENQLQFFCNEGIRIPHNSLVEGRLKDLRSKMIEALEWENYITDVLRKWTDIPANLHDVHPFAWHIYPKDTPQAENKRVELIKACADQMLEKGNTRWGLFNGLTYHLKGKQVLIGPAQKLIQNGFNFLNK